MLAGMSGRHFAEWIAYASLEPFGEERADLRMARLASVIVNSNPWRKKGAAAAKEKEFLFDFDREDAADLLRNPPEFTLEERREQARVIAAAFGALG